MKDHAKYSHAQVIPAFAGVVTVPGSYFMPLVEVVIDAGRWSARKMSALFGRA